LHFAFSGSFTGSPLSYSAWSATLGSTCVARLPGRYAARRAIAAKTSATARKIAGAGEAGEEAEPHDFSRFPDHQEEHLAALGSQGQAEAHLP
jgi:hypothetical protein